MAVLVVRARQQVSIAQSVRVLQGHRFDSCQGPKVAFFMAVPG